MRGKESSIQFFLGGSMNNVAASCGRSRKGFAVILVMCSALAGLCLSACATIMHGTRQEVGISSSPTGAEVWVDNVKMGETPVVAKLRRKDTHTVKLILPGYQPYETTITRSVSGWVWGNIAIGGLIGLGVDAISGGMYKLSPEQVSGNFAVERAAGLSQEDQLYIDVATKPQQGWEHIGQLQKTGL
jgi:PEGA domain